MHAPLATGQLQHSWVLSSNSSKQPLPTALLKELLDIAAGQIQPSPEQQQRISQMASTLLQDFEDGLPYADWEQAEQGQPDSDSADDAEQQGTDDMDAEADMQPAPHPQQRHRHAAAGAATAGGMAGAAGAGSSRHAAPQEGSQPAAQQQRRTRSAAAAAAAAAAATPPRQQVPAFGLDDGVPSPGLGRPDGLLITPSGQQYTRQQLQARHVGTTTPGGHYTTFMVAGAADAAAHEPAVPPPPLQRQQQWRQQQQQQYGASSMLQLQDEVDELTADVEQLEEHINRVGNQLGLVQAEILAPAVPGQPPADPQEQRLLDAAEEQAAQLHTELAGLRLSKKQKVLRLAQTDAQLRKLLQAEQEQQRQQRRNQSQAMHSRSSSGPVGGHTRPWGQELLQRMGGSVDPVNDMFHPYTAQQGISLSAYEPAMPGAASGGGQVPAAAVVEVVNVWGGRILDAITGNPAAAAAAPGSPLQPGGARRLQGAVPLAPKVRPWPLLLLLLVAATPPVLGAKAAARAVGGKAAASAVRT